MNKHTSKNMSASVHQRLKNIAKDTTRPFNAILQYYAMERFLFRLSQSQHADTFVLKGALLFRLGNFYPPYFCQSTITAPSISSG